MMIDSMIMLQIFGSNKNIDVLAKHLNNLVGDGQERSNKPAWNAVM